jgi:hypothetical protein
MTTTFPARLPLVVDGGSAAADVLVDEAVEARGEAAAREEVVATRLCVAVGLGRAEGGAVGLGVAMGVAVPAVTVAAARAGLAAEVLVGAQPVSATPTSTVAAATRRLMVVLVTLAPVVRLPPGRH